MRHEPIVRHMAFFSPSSYVTATGFITLESRSVRRKEKEEAKEGKRKVKFQLFFRQPRVAVPCTAECRGEEKERREREGRREREEGEGERKEKEKHRGGEVRFDTSRNNPGADWARIDESGGTPDARRRTTRRGEREVNRVARSIFRVPCPRRAGTGLENFGWLERGLGLSTHWQWSVMVTGEQASKRAIEQSSNRATEHTTNQFIHPMHGSVLHPALSRVRYVLARILHVLAICTTSFFANRN